MVERNLDFDRVVNRKNTMCLKYDFAREYGMPEDVLPLWVADMDFKTSSHVEDALANWAGKGIFGYSDTKISYFYAVRDWMRNHHDFEIREEWLIKTPGVVFALATAVRAYTNPGDAVLLQYPVYHPFSKVIQDNGRKVVSSDLVYGEDGSYHIDFRDFEEKLVTSKAKLFFLCSPHNPVGRVWTREELLQLGDLCIKYGVVVVSDEIHQDFVFKGKHSVFAGLREEHLKLSITCTSPSKTFNLAGMQLSNIFIPDEELRKKFLRQLDVAGISHVGIMGIVACEAAYRYGEEWYRAMLSYVRKNIETTRKFVGEELPGVRMADLEGTYLAWLDFNGTGLDAQELNQRMIHRAKLWLNEGKIFGEGGQGFERINIACPRSVLIEALHRIKKALE